MTCASTTFHLRPAVLPSTELCCLQPEHERQSKRSEERSRRSLERVMTDVGRSVELARRREPDAARQAEPEGRDGQMRSAWPGSRCVNAVTARTPLELRRRCDSVKEGGFDDAAKETGRP
jgi:hypothetical protein